MHKSHDEQTLKILNKDKISHGAEVNHVRIWGKKKKKEKTLSNTASAFI